MIPYLWIVYGFNLNFVFVMINTMEGIFDFTPITVRSSIVQKSDRVSSKLSIFPIHAFDNY
jgi:hypothetical protein